MAWSGQGPAPDPYLGGLSGLNVLKIVPTGLDKQVVLAATNVGIFLSTDHGVTWANESARPGSGLPTGVGVSDLLLAESLIGGGDVLYAAIPGWGVYRAVLGMGGEILDNGHFNPVTPTVAQLPLSWAPVNGTGSIQPPPVANSTAVKKPIANPVTAPTVISAGGAASGGMLQAGTYFVKYTWTDGTGETEVSPESVQFTVAAGNIPLVSLPARPAGVTGANIYLTQTDGASNSEFFYAATTLGPTSLTLIVPQATNDGLNAFPTPYCTTMRAERRALSGRDQYWPDPANPARGPRLDGRRRRLGRADPVHQRRPADGWHLRDYARQQ